MVAFITLCFFLVLSALRKFTLTFTSEFMSVRLFLIFSFSFLGCISLHAALLSFLSIRLCSLSLQCFECYRLRFVSLYWERFSLYYVPSPVLIYAYFGLRYLSGLYLLGWPILLAIVCYLSLLTGSFVLSRLSAVELILSFVS